MSNHIIRALNGIKKCLAMICVSVTSLILWSSYAVAQDNSGFVIRGLSIGMSIDEFRANLGGLGYDCAKQKGGGHPRFYCIRGDGKFARAVMYVGQDGLATAYRLRCGVTNSCRFTVDEVVSLLRDAGRIPDNAIEIKEEQYSDSQVRHVRSFVTPIFKMNIHCKSYDPYDRCVIHVNQSGKNHYPTF